MLYIVHDPYLLTEKGFGQKQSKRCEFGEKVQARHQLLHNIPADITESLCPSKFQKNWINICIKI